MDRLRRIVGAAAFEHADIAVAPEAVFARYRTESIGRVRLLRERGRGEAAAAEQRDGKDALHRRASVTRIGRWSDPAPGNRPPDPRPQPGPASTVSIGRRPEERGGAKEGVRTGQSP